ncbi:MAG: nitroreductase family protein [Candidatus Aminicenantes bacterium]|nr:nitroreductase family protein [Candidatus Aminicenantes bacterium]
MQYSKPVTEIIKQRSSRRSYRDQALDADIQKQLTAFMAGNNVGPFASSARFSLVAAKAGDSETLKGLGTYGFIRGARGFIVGAVKHSEKNLEDYGYMMERIILFATDLGLGTCWLGGTFNNSNFSKKIEAAEDESVPAVSPVGYIAEKRSVTERLVRWGAGSKMRHPWEALFFHETFNTPLSAGVAGAYALPLEMVRIAPSASNKQPWRIVKESWKPVFHLYLQRSKGYERSGEKFNTADLQRLDMGIAMCHFELSAKEMDLRGKWKIIPPAGLSLPERSEYIVSWLGDQQTSS